MNEAITNVALIVASTPAIVFADPRKAEELFAHIEREIAEFTPDLSTDKGRKAIASLAYKVAQTKTAIDAAGADLNEEANKRIGVVNAERRRLKARLEALQTKARQPLTEWETKEEQRIDYMRRMLAHIENCGKGTIDGVPQAYAILFRELQEKVVIDDSFGEFQSEAIRARDIALDRLRASMAAHEKAEADRAELELLRAAERTRQEIEAARKFEADALARAEADEAERGERERQAEVTAKRREDEAAERARIDEKRRADAAIATAEREKQAAIDEAARKDRVREAEAKRVADEQSARDADQKHRTEVKSAVKEALKSLGASESAAVKIVLAIIAGEIPNVTLRF
jgi:colicin import membrane protein